MAAKKVIVCFLMSLLKKNIHVNYGKTLYQILWGCINVKATHTCSSGPVEKDRKKKWKRKCNGLTGTQNGLIFVLGLPLNRNTDPRNRNQYIVPIEETYNFTIFSIQVCLRDIFFNHLAPPSKGELMPKAPYFYLFIFLA